MVKKKEVIRNVFSGKEKIMLHALLRNGRTFNTHIANRLNISSQVTGRIRNRLERDEIIKGYSIELNHNFLGIKTFVLALFNIEGSETSVMTENLVGFYKVLANSITHIGLYAFKDLEDSDKYFNSLIKNFDNIKIMNTYVFPSEGLIKKCPRNLFYNAVRDFDGKGSCNYSEFSCNSSRKIKQLNNSEKDVLKQLIKKSNISSKKISVNLNRKISRSSVNRIRIKLEKRGIIKRYNADLDYEKLGINVLAFIFVNPRSDLIKKQDTYIRQCHRSKNVIGCYRLNEETTLFCGFKDLNDLENYINCLRRDYKGLIELKHIHLISPRGVIKESFDDLFLSLLE